MRARLRIVLALSASLGVSIACGAPAPPPVRPPPAPVDDAVEVAAMLPDAVETCVVARPRLLPARRRALALVRSQAEPSVWSAELPVVAYASAIAETLDGLRARRSYYRFAAARPALDMALRALPVRWLDEPCDGIECRRPVARWVDERTVEVSRHPWPNRELSVSSAECVAMARSAPRAFELTVDSSRRPGLGFPLPRLTRTLSFSAPSELVTRREEQMRDGLEAQTREGWMRTHGPLPEASLMPSGPQGSEIERRGDRLVITESRLWEELELVLEDERLRRRAMALSLERSEPIPVDRVDVHNLAVVRHQLRLRTTALGRLSGPARAAPIRELARLLDAALAIHASDLEWVRTAIRLELDVLARPERVPSIVARVLASGIVSDPREWRGLRREALARGEPGALAAALEEDGIASHGDATRAAEDLVALSGAGVPYDLAEGAFQIGTRLSSSRPPRHRIDAQLPWEGVVGTLAVLATLSGEEGLVTLQLAVRVPTQSPPRAVGDSRPELLTFRQASGTVVVGATASVDPLSLRRLGATLAGLVEPGPVDLTVELGDPSGAVRRRVRISGVLRGGELTLERAEGADDVPWALVGRYLARPLVELPTALFPPPELTVRAESPEAAAALRSELPSGACRVAGPILRCSTPGRPEELGQILLSIARARLSP